MRNRRNRQKGENKQTCALVPLKLPTMAALMAVGRCNCKLYRCIVLSVEAGGRRANAKNLSICDRPIRCELMFCRAARVKDGAPGGGRDVTPRRRQCVPPAFCFFFRRLTAVSDRDFKFSKGPDAKPNKFAMVLTFFVAIGGFLFGYDTGVISGALLLVVDEFTLSSIQQEWVIASATAGAMVGALIGGNGLGWRFSPCLCFPLRSNDGPGGETKFGPRGRRRVHPGCCRHGLCQCAFCTILLLFVSSGPCQMGSRCSSSVVSSSALELASPR